jgi:hypothetical protein
MKEGPTYDFGSDYDTLTFWEDYLEPTILLPNYLSHIKAIPLSSVSNLLEICCIVERKSLLGANFLKNGGMKGFNWTAHIRRSLLIKIIDLLHTSRTHKNELLERIKRINVNKFSEQNCFVFEKDGMYWRNITDKFGCDRDPSLLFIAIHRDSFSRTVLKQLIARLQRRVHSTTVNIDRAWNLTP